MIVTDQQKISDIQRGFQQLFPHLKIEFYQEKHRPGQGSPAQKQLDPDALLRDVRTVHREGEVIIKEEMSVREFEKKLLDQFGLNAQVFRRSGNIWMQTTATDFWTLAEQNRKGGASEAHFNDKYNAER